MKKTFFALVGLFASFGGFTQNYLMFYNFEQVNQNLLVNPSNPHPYAWVVGIPGASNISVHYTNTIFKPGDYFNDNLASDNAEAIINGLDDKERFNAYQSADLIYAGFGTKNGYVSFGVQQETTLNFVIPGQLFKFLYYGNQNANGGLNFTSSNFNAEALIQVNYHVGYQRWLLDSNLVLGGRFKYISGTAHAHFKTFDVALESDIFEWKVKTDIQLETSGYGYIEDFENYNPIQFINSGNPGWGVDLGATYVLPKIKLSASVLNIGSINWTQEIKQYQSKGEYVWDGADIDEEDQEIDFDAILDSIEAELGFKELSPTSYRSKLPMHIMASFEYKLHPKHALALTYQGTSWSNTLYNNVGVNYIGRWGKRINLILSYGRLAGGLNNIGAGISTAAGPLQFYFMSDNIWGVYKPAELSATNFRLGINLAFFGNPDKKQKKETKTNPEIKL